MGCAKIRAASRLRNERSDHTLDPTGLVHEAYMRLAHQDGKHWNDRTHFYAVAARVVRIVELRHFAGLSIEETAQALGISDSSVKRGWLAATSWIRQRLDGRSPDDGA